MIQHYRTALNELLEKHSADQELVAQAKTDLAPFYRHINSGTYRFGSSDEADADAIVAETEKLTGWNIRRIAWIQASDPFPKPDWMTQSSYERSLHSILGAGIDEYLDQLAPSERPEKELPAAVRIELDTLVRRKLGEPLWDAIEKGACHRMINEGVDGAVRQSLKYGLPSLIQRYLALVISGDSRNAEKCGRLVRTFHRYLVIGLQKANGIRDSRGVLLVVCA